jgi:RNA polymerase sigma-70 factor (ECF subfamily)
MHALEQVGDVARACLLLRTIESLDYRQIAQLLEIPEGTAMSHVHRARRLLRGQLTQADVRVSGAQP